MSKIDWTKPIRNVYRKVPGVLMSTNGSSGG